MSNYDFLKNMGTLPRVITNGLSLLGTKEVVGKKHNPVILQWAKDVGLEDEYKSDEIPWCGLFVAKVCQMSGKKIVKDPLWARNWSKYGNKSKTPSLGDILTFSRESGGHVGFYIAEDKVCYHVLGGNQGNSVSITRIKKDRLLDSRNEYNVKPVSSTPIFINSVGVVSKNEA